MTGTPEKTAIVTGASGGIGREVAQRLARDGFAVVVGYAGNTALGIFGIGFISLRFGNDQYFFIWKTLSCLECKG